MSNKNSQASYLYGIDTFETFKIENKIKQLKSLAKSNQLHGTYVVIIVPSLNASKRLGLKNDKELYNLQQRDADILAQYIMINMNVDLVTIVRGMNQINNLVTGKEKIDYVVYLYQFIASERIMIEEVLKNNNENLKYFDLN